MINTANPPIAKTPGMQITGTSHFRLREHQSGGCLLTRGGGVCTVDTPNNVIRPYSIASLSSGVP
jgi:hypothetical protein